MRSRGEETERAVDIDASSTDVDHLIGAEEQFPLAMARQ